MLTMSHGHIPNFHLVTMTNAHLWNILYELVSQLFREGSDKISLKMGKNDYLYNPCVIFYQITFETVVSPLLPVGVQYAIFSISISGVKVGEGRRQPIWFCPFTLSKYYCAVATNNFVALSIQTNKYSQADVAWGSFRRYLRGRTLIWPMIQICNLVQQDLDRTGR